MNAVVELRFVERASPVADVDRNALHHVRILQYRVRAAQLRVERTEFGPWPPRIDFGPWSPWRDVPLEKEES